MNQKMKNLDEKFEMLERKVIKQGAELDAHEGKFPPASPHNEADSYKKHSRCACIYAKSTPSSHGLPPTDSRFMRRNSGKKEASRRKNDQLPREDQPL